MQRHHDVEQELIELPGDSADDADESCLSLTNTPSHSTPGTAYTSTSFDLIPTQIGQPYRGTKWHLMRFCVICKHSRCKLWTHRDYMRRLENATRVRLRQLDDNKADPFARHPIKMTPVMHELYKHCWLKWNPDFTAPERHIFPHSRFRLAFEEAWDDQALHYGMLGLVATQTSMMHFGEPNEIAIVLYSQCVAAQRKAIEQESQSDLSDARILTALIIMYMAHVVNSSRDGMGDHMKLIADFVERRGGQNKFGMKGLIADNLQYADHVQSVIANRLPRYAMTLPHVEHEGLPAIGKAYDALFEGGLLCMSVKEAANVYLKVMGVYERASRGESSPGEITYLPYLGHVLEYRLACCNADHHGQMTLNNCLTMALLVSSHCVTRNYGRMVTGIIPMVSRFWECFEALREELYFEQNDLNELEIWFACIGGLVSLRSRNESIQKTVQALKEIRFAHPALLDSFEDLCRILQEYGWCRYACSPFFLEVWNSLDRIAEVQQESLFRIDEWAISH